MESTHIFEHIGPAPYRFQRYERLTYQACPGAPIQVGGSCDHCGTGIMDAFWFLAADGKLFKVGSTCVGKAGDRGLQAQIAPEVRRLQRERKAERDAMKLTGIDELIQANEAKLQALPHPMGFTDRKTGQALSLLDWASWMLDHAGTSGKLRVASRIRKALA